MPKARPALLAAVKLAITVALLTALVRTIGWGEIVAALSQASLPLVALASLVGIGGRWLAAHQLAVIMRRAEMPVTTRRVMLANCLGTMYAMVLPGDLLAGAAKWSNLAAATGNSVGALHAMLYNRIITLLPWLAVGLAAVAFERFATDPLLAVAAVAMLLTAVAGVAALYGRRTGRQVERAIVWAASKLPVWIGSKLIKVAAAIEPIREFSWRMHLAMAGYGMAGALVTIGSFSIMARAAGIDAPLLTLAWCNALLTFLRLLPISFNGLGVREATLVAVLGRYGVAPSVAFGFGMLNFLNLLLVAAIGAGYQVALGFGWANWNRDASAVSPEPKRLAA